MRRFINKRRTSLLTISFVVLTAVSGGVFSQDSTIDVEALKMQLEEAKALLEKDTALHGQTADKKAAIDEKLAAQKEREIEIKEELELLCAEQDKLQPGSLDACLAKLAG